MTDLIEPPVYGIGLGDGGGLPLYHWSYKLTLVRIRYFAVEFGITSDQSQQT